MCGIAVVVSRRPEAVRSALEAAVRAQCHRGPDDDGHEYADLSGVSVGLGQRRLSIIDLSPLGHQPMAHPETGDLLVYNGELYNFQELRKQLEAEGIRFRGRSDTEVMLHALARWGTGVLPRFHGMFALAWFRRAERRILFARDPLGIKPLYFARSREFFCAASEVRAILATGIVERRVNRKAVAGLLAYGAVQEPETIIQGVRSFPAGSWQEIELDTVLEREPAAPKRYWRPPPVDHGITEGRAVEITRSVLDASVRDHLIADVPVGVFLSSGLDSTIVAGLAARHQSNIRTYTVGFADNPDMSESPAASRTAREFGLPHMDVQITGAEAMGSVARWLDALDQPSIDGLNTYVVSGAVKRAGLTVALSGLGGDELFCGYSTFVDVPRLQGLMRHARFIPGPLRAPLAHVASIGRPLAYRQKLMEIAQTDGSLADLYFQRRRVLSTRQLSELGVNPRELGLTSAFMPPEALEGLDLDEADPVVGVSILESRYYTGNMLLRDSDTNGMAHSLEIRVPFFDTRVLDAVMPIPAHVRMPQWRADKHLLRSAFSDFLRPELKALTKRGFSLPIARWMGTSLRGMCEAALTDLKNSGTLDPRGIDAVWRAFLAEPDSPIWSRAFSLCVLGSYINRLSAAAKPKLRIA